MLSFLRLSQMRPQPPAAFGIWIPLTLIGSGGDFVASLFPGESTSVPAPVNLAGSPVASKEPVSERAGNFVDASAEAPNEKISLLPSTRPRDVPWNCRPWWKITTLPENAPGPTGEKTATPDVASPRRVA